MENLMMSKPKHYPSLVWKYQRLVPASMRKISIPKIPGKETKTYIYKTEICWQDNLMKTSEMPDMNHLLQKLSNKPLRKSTNSNSIYRHSGGVQNLSDNYSS